MRTLLKATLPVLSLLALSLSGPGAMAAPAPSNPGDSAPPQSDRWSEDAHGVLEAFFSRYNVRSRFDGKAERRRDHGIRIVLEDGASALRGVELVAEKDAFVTFEEVVEHQYATFFVLDKFRMQGRSASLEFNLPSNARFGVVNFQKTPDGTWEIADEEIMRSSSGSRAFYGELYEGVACRDDTEMAFRWNAYESSRGQPYSGKCPGEEFPDVDDYRSVRAMRARSGR
ncbi:hypothetical protein [Marilutibacter maris]|uniref:Uncharacterized protein n=1 Tax=Marilutibacter maris TaxID=1605891 RepID=A0A2U9T1K8_9GAMM|nr:hypothetical protein [Lysobacter maris]AWV06261.1 hypothetical protein C9I47_0538 [Lysobacter maris]